MTRFQKGQSGNPSGRPKRDEQLISAARERTQQALSVLESIMRDKRAPAAARVAAAREILDRGWGRPTQDVRLDAEVNGAILVSTEAFVRPRTYTDWLQYRELTASQPAENGRLTIDDRDNSPISGDGFAVDLQ